MEMKLATLHQKYVRRVNLCVDRVNVLTREANVMEGLIVGTNQMKQIVVSWRNQSCCT